jgi:hypothetical protein
VQLSLGNMSAHHLFNWREHPGRNIQETVQAFLTVGEAVLSRWIQGPKGLMLLPMVPGDQASGAIYVFDLKQGDWFMLCFEDAADDQFTADQFEKAFREYGLFKYLEDPGLLAKQAGLAQGLTLPSGIHEPASIPQHAVDTPSNFPSEWCSQPI